MDFLSDRSAEMVLATTKRSLSISTRRDGVYADVGFSHGRKPGHGAPRIANALPRSETECGFAWRGCLPCAIKRTAGA